VIDWLYQNALPIFAALVAGSIIGLERGLRSEPAGFRTHALVCAASAAVTLASVHLGRELHEAASASRAIQGIIVGVGFLGAGVIFRERLTVHGLTTAASVWATAGLGVVFGAERYGEGWVAVAALMIILVGLRVFDQRLPRHGHAELTIRYKRGKETSEQALHAFLGGMGVKAFTIRHRLCDGTIEHSAHIQAHREVPTQAISAALAQNPDVVGFDIEPLGG
jgi:putative Mg2+ transporter-C (MgtC) family protein